jgi:tetratricopeptide (TPR) repeat protein
MKRTRFDILLRVSFILFLLLGTVALAEAEGPLAGKLIQLQGRVAVCRAGTQDWTPGRLGQDLFAGDAVQTGSVSRAAILAVDESQIKLNENTIFILKSAAPSPRLGWGQPVPAAAAEPALSLYQVPQGEIWLRNGKEKFRFEIETPALTAAVRGTEVDLRVARDGFTAVVLLSGALVLANAQGQVALNPGEEGSARPGEAPTKRVLVQPADAVQWSLAYPGIVSFRDLPLTPGNFGRRAPAGPPAAASLVRQAEADYDQGRLDQSQNLAEQALAVNRGNARALTLLGWIFLQRHDSAAAEGYFRQVAAPDDAAVVGLALSLYRQGRVWEAYEIMRQARGRPTPLLTTMTGYFALMAGKVDQARKLLETAAARAPDEALPRALLAQIAIVQNRKQAGRRNADQALALNPRSPAAQVTMALVDLSFFKMDAARGHLEKALQADPRFVQAYVYLARIWLGSDYLSRAWRTIKTALELAPHEAEVLSTAGFVRLGYRDYQRAREFFDRAVQANPNFGDPHLGLGQYHFRYRAFDRGLAEILTATLLEPRVSQFQSFLGKAFYQMRGFDKALETYDYAKTLDPLDPTPYLYKGIALTDLNRPGEAIQEFNQSIALNDNRAVFRSRLMLDRDLAVRNYNLAYAYSYLGLGDWAYSKALTAAKKDPTNSSAQLFLSRSFAATRQRVGASNSAFLLYKLLSPANQNTFATGNDYTPMFEMPYARVLATGEIGVWDSIDQNIQNYSLDIYGGLPGLAGEVFGSYGRDQGFRRHNSDIRTQYLGGLVKWDTSPKTSLLFQSTYFDQERGDTLFLHNYFYQNSPYYRQFSSHLILEGGLVHRFSPSAILLAYMNYTRINTRFNDLSQGTETAPYVLPYTLDTLPGYSFYDLGTLTYDYDFYTQDKRGLDLYNPQIQQMLILGKHTLLLGFDYIRGVGDYEYADLLALFYRYFTYGNQTFVTTPSGFVLDLGAFWEPYVEPLNTRSLSITPGSFGFPKWAYNFYAFDYWRFSEKLLLELGVAYKSAKTPNLRVPRDNLNDLWSPRLGINYYITPDQVIRVGAYTTLSSFDFQASLAPSEVAGVPFDINAFEGAEVREIGMSWEGQWTPKTFTVVKAGAIRVANPLVVSETSPITYLTWREYYASAGLNQILTPYLGLYLAGAWKRFDTTDRNDTDFSEIDGLAKLTFWHKSGLRAFVSGTLVSQDLRTRAADLFVLADAGIGYEFPGKRGQAFLTVINIFNRHFNYLVEPIKLEPFFASRRVTFRLSFYF